MNDCFWYLAQDYAELGYFQKTISRLISFYSLRFSRFDRFLFVGHWSCTQFHERESCLNAKFFRHIKCIHMIIMCSELYQCYCIKNYSKILWIYNANEYLYWEWTKYLKATWKDDSLILKCRIFVLTHQRLLHRVVNCAWMDGRF